VWWRHRRAPENGPVTAPRAGRPDLRRAVVSGTGAIVALAVGSDLGDVHGPALHARVIVLGAALAFLTLGVVAVRGAAGEVFSAACLRVGHSGPARCASSSRSPATSWC